MGTGIQILMFLTELEYFCTPEDYTQMPVNLCSFSWSKQPGMQLLDHMVSIYLVFTRNSQTAFQFDYIILQFH